MKPEEAIERLEYLESALDGYPPETGINDVFAAIDTAIKALEEIQQYKEIGTVEECREAVEKQKAKKPVLRNDNGKLRKSCSVCGCFFSPLSRSCPKCGQAIKRDENLEVMEDESKTF